MSSKLTELDELTSITDTTDLVYMVDAPGTTPVSKKTQISTLKRDLFNNVEIQITSSSHGFVAEDVGKPITKYSNGTYAFSQADTLVNVETVGIMSDYVDANIFKIIHSGKFTKTSHGYTGPVVFVSPTSAGGLTETVPTTAGQFIKPIYKVIDANTLEVIDYMAVQVVAVNNDLPDTNITLSDETTKNASTSNHGFLPKLTTAYYYGRINSAATALEYVTDRLFTNTTVNFTSDMTVAQMVALINAVPKNLNGYTLTFQFANGTYNTSMSSYISILNFYGGGPIYIKGNAGESGNHTNQAVILDFSASSTNGIYISNCTGNIEISNIAIKIKDAATRICVDLEFNLGFAKIYQCYFYSAAKTTINNGIYSYRSGVTYSYLNTFSNLNKAMRCDYGTLLSESNYTTGFVPTYGLAVYNGASINKIDATQPAGTTAAEVGSGSQGALIR